MFSIHGTFFLSLLTDRLFYYSFVPSYLFSYFPSLPILLTFSACFLLSFLSLIISSFLFTPYQSFVLVPPPSTPFLDFCSYLFLIPSSVQSKSIDPFHLLSYLLYLSSSNSSFSLLPSLSCTLPFEPFLPPSLTHILHHPSSTPFPPILYFFPSPSIPPNVASLLYPQLTHLPFLAFPVLRSVSQSFMSPNEDPLTVIPRARSLWWLFLPPALPETGYVTQCSYDEPIGALGRVFV